MSSVSDRSGDRLIPTGFDTQRWQHRLFAEIRTAPAYRPMLTRLRGAWEAGGHPDALPETLREGFYLPSELDRSSPYFLALEQAARDLRLTKRVHPAGWAVMYLHDDVT